MCARYSLHSPMGRLQEELLFTEGLDALSPQWNVAPTHPVVVVQARRKDRVATRVKWGAEGGTRLLLNARSETAIEKPTYAAAMRSGRCLVPADGFYEWRAEGKLRQPWFITPTDGSLFALGGLILETAKGPRCVLLTTEANEAMRDVHDRMPLVVPVDARDAWLDAEVPPQVALELVPRPFPAELTRLTRVNPLVNSVRNDGPELLDPPPQASLF